MGSVIPGESPSDLTLTALVAPLIDPQTYKHLVYFVLAFPLGAMYSFGLSLGLLFGIGLSILGIGLGILLALVVVSRGLAAFERWLANRLLNVSLAAPPAGSSDDGLRETIRSYLATETTWRGLAFVLVEDQQADVDYITNGKDDPIEVETQCEKWLRGDRAAVEWAPNDIRPIFNFEAD